MAEIRTKTDVMDLKVGDKVAVACEPCGIEHIGIVEQWDGAKNPKIIPLLIPDDGTYGSTLLRDTYGTKPSYLDDVYVITEGNADDTDFFEEI